MKIEPIGDRVIIIPDTKQEKTEAGVLLGDHGEKPRQGIIHAVGPGTEKVKMTTVVGDKIMFGKYSGQSFKIEGKDYLVMRQEDILFIYREYQ